MRSAWAVLISMPALVIGLGLIIPSIFFVRISFGVPSRAAFSEPGFTTENYLTWVRDPFYLSVLRDTAAMATIATVISTILGLLLGWHAARSAPRKRGLLIILSLFPWLTGAVVRSIGWNAIFGYRGLVSSMLVALKIIPEHRTFTGTFIAVTISLAFLMIPVSMVLLTNAFSSIDPATERAAMDLGTGPLVTFWRVTFPQVAPAVLAAASITFILNMNAYATPLIVGGPTLKAMATTMYSTMVAGGNWPLGATFAVILVIASVGSVLVMTQIAQRTILRWRYA